MSVLHRVKQLHQRLPNLKLDTAVGTASRYRLELLQNLIHGKAGSLLPGWELLKGG